MFIKSLRNPFFKSLKNDGKNDGKSSVVLIVNPDQMNKNIPNDASFGKSHHIGIQVLSQMFKGYGENIWNKTEEKLEESNFHLNFIAKEKEISNIEESDIAVIIDSNEMIYQLPKKTSTVLLNYEPPLMDPKAYELSYLNKFKKVLTVLDKNKNYAKSINPDLTQAYFKYCYPVKRPEIEDLDSIPYQNRKLCCLIATEKNNAVPGELLYLRKSIVKFFNEHHPQDFEVYGKGWDLFPNINKGLVDCKDKKIQEFKFILCPENMELDGYITEKLFDAFANGVVPIWQGPFNADDYIPRECYVDLRKYSTPESLFEYISNLSENEWNIYRQNAKNYLESDGSKCFSVDAFINNFVQTILFPVI